ncbi:protein kinase family protein [Planosporangium flavigriseum]|uniref:Serine/threonine protein kinase n=1 Tax=Planosporangium flavigriseum TaxID=373681 RepID=A0A8J3LQA2_9ACTN|nr:serine/threonine protein kinase [Planosporangium flavigriseum]
MTQNGEGQEALGAAPQVLTFGAPAVGEVLAERYRLEEHVNNDSLGRQLWRGADVVLRRPVAVVLRYPGGDSASEMLSAAVASSRIVHPHLVGVYDAIDESERAYVVREWVDGSSLRDLVSDGPLDPDRAATIACAVADAVAAIHGTGMAHGNIHPGTVLIAADGRVVLADARADEATTTEADLRAIGAILYCALTGYWPHAEAGPTSVPDAIRDSGGNLAAPRQVRGGVPSPLDELTMDLLNPALPVPSADVLVGELGRFEQTSGHPLFMGEDSGFHGFDSAAVAAAAPRPTNRKIVVGIAGLIVIALAGVLGATKVLTGRGDPVPQGGGGKASASAGARSGPITDLKLSADQVRILDDVKGNHNELDTDVKKTVDGDPTTVWRTDQYQGDPNFGTLKSGMGLLFDLGSEKHVVSVKVQLATPGATMELRASSAPPSDTGTYASVTTEGNALKINGADFTLVGEVKQDAGTTVVLPGPPDSPVRYLAIWITKLPPLGGGKYQVGVQDVAVSVQ